MHHFPALFTPVQVGSKTYKNRIVAAPIYCGSFINLPFLSDVLIHGMTARAEGGAAQVTIGETPVDFTGASREPFPPIDYTDLNDPAFAKFKDLVSVIHANGAVAMIELSHCGESVEKIPGVTHAIGPMGYIREDGMQVIAMNKPMMDEVIRHFIICARFMKAAGFDGVMLHTGHGWLAHQFLSARTNKRQDEYGGSLENRARFPLALIAGVREAMGQDFVIEIRVSGDECMPDGMGIDETAAFCKMAEPLVDLIHVSVGVYRNPILSGEFSSLFQPHGLNAGFSRAIKEKVKIPVVVVGGINNPALAEDLIKSGKCDIVALGRQLTADPDFPGKAQSGREDDINPCLRCYKCFPGPLEGVIDDLASIFGCSVNPREFFFDSIILNSKPAASRKVLVVGGGIAGMQAAIIAAERGHRVTLLEKEDHLGGALRFADTDSYKGDLRDFKEVMKRRVLKKGVEVVLNHAFKPEDVESYQADAVIIAIGAEPLVPPIKGIENAMHAVDMYGREDAVGRKVVMVGGGLIGCEAGLHLAKLGHEVTIIEMLEEVAPDAYPMHRIGLINELKHLLTFKTGLKCTSIEKDRVQAVDKSGHVQTFEADTVLFALGMRARCDEKETIAKSVQVPVYGIGDCSKAGKVFDAVRQAMLAAYAIL